MATVCRNKIREKINTVRRDVENTGQVVIAVTIVDIYSVEHYELTDRDMILGMV